MSDALTEFEAVATRSLPPDPGILKAIGLNHGFETAISDLVDNSLDADASRILVRFVLRDGLVAQLLVVDNGCGMDSREIDNAMMLGRPKGQAEGAMGHFGMGLKSASFSQASELTVLSRKSGAVAQGRRMLRDADNAQFDVEVLAEGPVETAFTGDWTDFDISTGTIVRWDAIRTFPASRDQSVTDAFVEAKVAELRQHLGLMFHRLLERNEFSIDIDVYDADCGETGFPFSVESIDPFGYSRSGVTGYPKTLLARFRSKSIPLVCHIWSGRSDSHLFKLAGAPIDKFQGFYIYRHNRLLSVGGWGGVTHDNKRRRLARVAIDIEEHLDAFVMSVEKSSVRMVADLVHAIENAVGEDGTTFRAYLEVAEEAFRQSNSRVRRRTPILPPGQGIAPTVRTVIEREVECLEGEEPLRIRWKQIADGDFVEVDRRDRTLWLNTTYREAILRGGRGGVNDAPLLKALMFLLYEDIFRGSAFGPNDKDNVALWLEVLTAAAKEEVRDFEI